MTQAISHHEALIYVMVTMSAVDRKMTDAELHAIGEVVQTLPVFRGFNVEQLVPVAEACGDLLNVEDGLDEILDIVARSLPHKLYETAYAVAVEVAAVDLHVEQEELRFLQMLRDRLNLDKLSVAAIERGARARYMTI
ncbi:MAG TPA: tellurite resistance TerB family protein [Kaistiaceae bacterium]|nr:tellurite resistance TerB family protein [Kaistiaceae bacterium]